ncbi:unnamed protein product [Linum trigynum]|uniref:Uncharacterized protein n=1 Tax=Linum trigynum TaxID=586398 RepID=A0AAV2EHQ0_9ROSI
MAMEKKELDQFQLSATLDLKRAKSLTDDDLDELKGCLDLGFGGFSYDEIPELCNSLPALELCYSMSQKFLDDTAQKSSSAAEGMDSSSDGVAASDQAASRDGRLLLRLWNRRRLSGRRERRLDRRKRLEQSVRRRGRCCDSGNRRGDRRLVEADGGSSSRGAEAYSIRLWFQLLTSAYSILADCGFKPQPRGLGQSEP